MESGSKLMNVTRLVAVTLCALMFWCFLVYRGDFLPKRVLVELGFVWIGMVLGCKLNAGKKARTIAGALSLPLLVLWSLWTVIIQYSSVLFRLYTAWFISPLAFFAFGFAHSGIMSEGEGKNLALKSALFLSLLFPLIIVSAYIGNGWTARQFLELDRIPWESFAVIRESSWVISMFLRLVFYVFLVRMFRSEQLQAVSSSKWFKWIAGFLIAFSGFAILMGELRSFHFWSVGKFIDVLIIPAVWYVIYYLYRVGRKGYGRFKQIKDYVKKMDEENKEKQGIM